MNSTDNARSRPLRLHLGCGEVYLKEYVNIDFPQSEHTIARVRADEYKDLRALEYAQGVVDEVRSHHLLEHFSRGEAVGLLLNWRRWLISGGLLVVETPDFEESAKDFLRVPFAEKGQLLRHIYGSHEASWAVHCDGWFEGKYRHVMEMLGFEVIRILKMRNNVAKRLNYRLSSALDGIAARAPAFAKDATGINTLPNILCVAKKAEREINEKQVAEEMLAESLIGNEKKNKRILEVWMEEARKVTRRW